MRQHLCSAEALRLTFCAVVSIQVRANVFQSIWDEHNSTKLWEIIIDGFDTCHPYLILFICKVYSHGIRKQTRWLFAYRQGKTCVNWLRQCTWKFYGSANSSQVAGFSTELILTPLYRTPNRRLQSLLTRLLDFVGCLYWQYIVHKTILSYHTHQ